MGRGGEAFYLQTGFCFLLFNSYLIQFRKQTELGVKNEEMVPPGSCAAAVGGDGWPRWAQGSSWVLILGRGGATKEPWALGMLLGRCPFLSPFLRANCGSEGARNRNKGQNSLLIYL